MSNTNNYQSWGRYPKAKQQRARHVFWQNDLIDFSDVEGTVLPYGLGRSYGDSCLNEGGTLLITTPLNRFLEFNPNTGLIRCEAGVSLAELNQFLIPKGWFLPTTPGTKFVTIGGAIANDVHGKNHHVKGTFGSHVTRFELLRSDGERLLCSPNENSDFYRATIGGLGLTGLILWAEFQLRRIPGPYIAQEKIRFNRLDEFFEISRDSDHDYEYTVSWVDCVNYGDKLGRGIFIRGNHTWQRPPDGKTPDPKPLATMPIDMPSAALNPLTMRLMGEAYYRAMIFKFQRKIVGFDPFFYPLDMILEWNKAYGAPGFLQYQFVLPMEHSSRGMKEALTRISASGLGSFVTVLKICGDLPSPGMLSFPRPGVTLALDFPFRGSQTLRLLDQLDELVMAYGGAVYPAKDARMSPQMFAASFPKWREFAQYVDPKFSSSFWRRVTRTLLQQDTEPAHESDHHRRELSYRA
ncbi:MAG: FAD-binding oxidoreductase [Anaerolineae bacterium]